MQERLGNKQPNTHVLSLNSMKKSINEIISWKPIPEIQIKYDPIQRTYYTNVDKRCIYPQWEKKYGIHKTGGNFPVMVARHHYEGNGYLVEDDYCLIRKPNQRMENKGFQLICKIFGEKKVQHVIEKAEEILFSLNMRRGGDPDMFAYKSDQSELFFVEVKEKDQLKENQKIVISVIQKYLCPVLIVRVKKFK